MYDSQSCDTTIAAFTLDYQHYLADVGGMAPNSCDLHLRLVRRLLTFRFPSGDILWSQVVFSDVADFLTIEFTRLPHYATQQTWLMIIRRFLRHLDSRGLISKGWESALPKRARKKHSALPRYLSLEQTRALWNTCRKLRSHRHARDRALLFIFTRLALRSDEVARITLGDVDWEQGTILIRSTKVRRERILPLSQEVGEALVEHIRMRPQNSAQVFGPRQPPFTAKRCRRHITGCVISLFRRAGLSHARAHSLRHTAATGMVNSGASFKEIADVLGHKGLASTLIYAKLDMKALGKVCMPWPEGAR